MRNKLENIFLIIIGVLLSWLLINTFLITISLGQFIIIELIISLFHNIYNKNIWDSGTIFKEIQTIIKNNYNEKLIW